MSEHMDESDDHLGPVAREGILLEAQRLHDLRYGIAHCDRKYVQVCGQFQAALFEASQNLRTPPVRHERGCAADVAPGARCQCVTPPGQTTATGGDGRG